jgi:hypothetical protein
MSGQLPPARVVPGQKADTRAVRYPDDIQRHSSTLPARRSRTTAHGPRPTAHGPRPTAHGSRPIDHGPRITYHGHRMTEKGPRHAAKLPGGRIRPVDRERARAGADRELERVIGAARDIRYRTRPGVLERPRSRARADSHGQNKKGRRMAGPRGRKRSGAVTAGGRYHRPRGAAKTSPAASWPRKLRARPRHPARPFVTSRAIASRHGRRIHSIRPRHPRQLGELANHAP